MTFPATLLGFQRVFPDEAACWRFLRRARWPRGFRCQQWYRPRQPSTLARRHKSLPRQRAGARKTSPGSGRRRVSQPAFQWPARQRKDSVGPLPSHDTPQDVFGRGFGSHQDLQRERVSSQRQPLGVATTVPGASLHHFQRRSVRFIVEAIYEGLFDHWSELVGFNNCRAALCDSRSLDGEGIEHRSA